MENSHLFTNINTSFDKQQNPLQSIELPCDKEYNQVNLGAAAYFLLLDYPADVKVYVSLNSNRESAFLVDNRNTGFRINDVYTPQGLVSMTKNVYLWTEGITGLLEKDGTPYKIRLALSALPQFEIINNSAINAIESIGQIGRIDGLIGYPSRAKTLCGLLQPKFSQQISLAQAAFGGAGVAQLFLGETESKIYVGDLKENSFYMLVCEAVLDMEMLGTNWNQQNFSTSGKRYMPSMSAHAHIGLKINANITNPNIHLTPNQLFTITAKTLWGVMNWGYKSQDFAFGGGHSFDNQGKFQFTGNYIRENFLDDEGNLTFHADLQYIRGAAEDSTIGNNTNSKMSYQFAFYEII